MLVEVTVTDPKTGEKEVQILDMSPEQINELEECGAEVHFEKPN